MRQSEFVEYIVHDLLSDTNARARAMFGGWGIYIDDIMVGLVADDELYFKVDDENRPEYEACGSRPFVYEGHKNKKVTMSYWLVPADALEDTHALQRLAQLSLAAARRKRK